MAVHQCGESKPLVSFCPRVGGAAAADVRFFFLLLAVLPGGVVRVVGAIVADYKSVRMAEVPLGGLTVLLGPNGAGKTNIIEAVGAHDPVARHLLRRSDSDLAPRARVGLVVKFDIDSMGHGADAELLRQMMIWPWQEGLDADEITDGIGAYCGSTWWLYGGDLYDVVDSATLSDCYDVVRRCLSQGIPKSAAPDVQRLVDLLLMNPVLIVQEDFKVELACDRSSAAGQEAMVLARRIKPLLFEGALRDIVGVLTAWTGRWPPLTGFTRGPSSGSPAIPAGFEWVTSRLGGVRVVDGDAVAVERYLDRALETVHDRLFHQPEFGDGSPGHDEYCDRCLHSDHAGRVDPSLYAPDEAHVSDDQFVYPGSSDWLEQNNEWLRVRPQLRSALSVVEHAANARLIPFVAAQGEIRLEMRRVPEWDSSASRCQVTFKHRVGEARRIEADWNGPVGVVGADYPQQHLGEAIPLAHLGAGIQRWVATAVRLAADSCAEGDSDLTPRILLIDEPEQHLHPAAQAEVAVWCLDQARAHQAVVVATHSPVFIALPPHSATVCQVTRIGATTQVRALPPVHGPDVAFRAWELGFELGLGRDALAQLTRAIVVVEGDWDRRLLHHFYGSQLAKQRVLVVPLQGSNELGGLADAAVIPALGLPVVALLDEVRGRSREELESLTPPLTKAERALLDLSTHLGDRLRFVRYDDPDVICALPENAVRRAYPAATFPGWDTLLQRWKEERTSTGASSPFKRWALKAMALPKAKRFPTAFFSDVIEHCRPEDVPHARFQRAAEQLLELVEQGPD
ncbi:AAA family ATPase [Micromonospora aurantiaca (nom. illeg.)]|uniref:AAA family ATPase n=1 Tax=Micromonospora aurantiaca (nom. illeg.) TaxID=47850 RepID=UPI00364F5C50